MNVILRACRWLVFLGQFGLSAAAVMAVIAVASFGLVEVTMDNIALRPSRSGHPAGQIMIADDGQSAWVTWFPTNWQRVEIETGRSIASGFQPEAASYGVQMTRGGSHCVYGDKSLRIRVVRMGTHEPEQMLECGDRPPNRIVLGADPSALTNSEKRLVLWNLEVPDLPVAEITLPEEPNIVKWTPDGQNVIVVMPNRMSLLHGQTLQTLSSIATSVFDISLTSISQDGRMVAAGAHYGSILLWDIRNETQALCYNDDNYHSVIALSPDGSQLMLCDHDGIGWLIDTANPAQRETFGRLPALATDACYSVDGSRLLIGLMSGELLCWSLKDREIAWRIAPPDDPDLDLMAPGGRSGPILPLLTPIRG